MTFKEIPKTLMFAVIATVAFFVVIEGILWAVGGVQSRWPRHEPIRASDAQRPILCAGDSVTFGLGADTDHSYPSQLAEIESIRAFQLEIVNLGRAGQTMRDVIHDLDTYFLENPLQQATVLLLAGFNDCYYLPDILSSPRPIQSRTRPLRDLLMRVRTYRLMTQLIARAHGGAPQRMTILPPMGVGQDVEMCRYKLTTDGLDLALNARDLHKFQLLASTYPVPLAPKYSDLPRVTAQVNVLLREECARRDIPLLDVEDCVKKAEGLSSVEFYDPDGIHLHAEGYGAMARCMAERLPATLGRVPRRLNE